MGRLSASVFCSALTAPAYLRNKCHANGSMGLVINQLSQQDATLEIQDVLDTVTPLGMRKSVTVSSKLLTLSLTDVNVIK